MTFNVKYRASNGQIVYEDVTAKDRSTCLEMLKDRRVAVLSITVYRPGSGSETGHTNWWRVILFCLVLAIICVFVALTIRGERQDFRTNVVKNQPPIREKTLPIPVKITDITTVQSSKIETDEIHSLSNRVDTETVPVTNHVTNLPVSGYRKYTLKDGTVVERRSVRIFNDDLDRMISSIFTPHGMMGHLSSIRRRYSDKEIMKSLTTPIIYGPEDTERTIEIKLKVQDAKDEILGFIKAGGTLDEAFNEIQTKAKQDKETQILARYAMIDAIRTGDAELVRRVVEMKNKELREKGLREMRLPSQFTGQNVIK